MNAEQLLKHEQILHDSCTRLLEKTKLLERLKPLGSVEPMGSYVTGLMAWPDLDMAIGARQPDSAAMRLLIETLHSDVPEIYKLTFADLDRQHPGSNTFYLGLQVLFEGRDWKVDITMVTPDKVVSDPRLVTWLKNMTPEQRIDILRLKTELMAAHRYLGAKSEPPKSFRSIHLYEGVFEGKAKTILDLERYFAHA